MLTQIVFDFLLCAPQSSLVPGPSDDDLCLLQVLKDTGGYAYSVPATDSHSAFLRLWRAGLVAIEQSDDQSLVKAIQEKTIPAQDIVLWMERGMKSPEPV